MPYLLLCNIFNFYLVRLGYINKDKSIQNNYNFI